MGEEGFSSDSSLLYHRGVPVGDRGQPGVGPARPGHDPNHPLKPRHLKLHELFGDAAWRRRRHRPPAGARQRRRADQLRVSDAPSPFYRNAVGDECVYVESGAGARRDGVRRVAVPQGDYVSCRGPRPTAGCQRATSRLYAIEGNSHIAPPKRYLSRYGQLLEHAPYCERDLHGPVGPLAGRRRPTSRCTSSTAATGRAGWSARIDVPRPPVRRRRLGRLLYPYTFNVEDFEPITGRVHQPPPAHQVFEGYNFVICNFVPRKVDYHPLSIPVPYYHSNVDSDEVMFYVGGDYEARKGSGHRQGSISLHPGGHAHGPQPGAVEARIGVEYFDELAVMVDTFRPLELGEGGGPATTASTPGAGPAGRSSGSRLTASGQTSFAMVTARSV